MTISRALGLTLSLPVLFACGAPPDDGDTTTAPTDRVIVTVDAVSSTNDCDPAKGNPGDFTVFIEGFTKLDYNEFGAFDRVAVSEPESFTLNAEKGDRKTHNLRHVLAFDVPRRDNFSFAATAHAAERDGGREDSRLSHSTSYYFDADLECWFATDARRCGGQALSRSRTFREDEFKLFNSDDEGCQITIRWSVAIEAL